MIRRIALVACALALVPSLTAPLGGTHAGIVRAAAPASSQRPRDTVGDWTSAEISLIQYQNVTTGANQPTSGSHMELDVTPDGRYTRSGLLQVTSYSCTDTLFQRETGKAVVAADRLTLIPATNTLSSTDNCISRYNYAKRLPLTTRVYRWKVDRFQRGTKLCLLNEDGREQPGCYWRSGKPDTGPTAGDGATWTRRPTRIQQALRGVSCRSASACLAVGDEGTIARSADGGASWQDLTSPSFDDGLKAINCPNTCVAVGVDDILRGGGDGHLQAQPSDAWLLGVDCPSASTCVAVGNGGAIATSTDGGATWKAHSLGLSTLLNSISCPSAGLCVAVGGSWGEQGTILTSADNGATWTRRLANNKFQLDGVSCPTARQCVAVGGDSYDGVILTSADGGATWKPHAPGIDNILQGNPLHGVTCPSASTCIAVGDSGTILASADSGASWAGQAAAGGDSRSSLRAVSCASASTCVAVGDRGIILHLWP